MKEPVNDTVINYFQWMGQCLWMIQWMGYSGSIRYIGGGNGRGERAEQS